MLIGGILKHDTSDTDHSDSGAWNADACGHMYPSDGRPYTRTFDGSVAKMLEYRAMQLWRHAILNGRPLKPEFEVKPYIAQMFHYRVRLTTDKSTSQPPPHHTDTAL